jgi:ketosteroid isomerase-like protein
VTTDEIRELDRRWVAAEEQGDIDALDAMSTPDFTLVGPLGFVLDKQQWLHRYRTGELVTRSLVWHDVEVRQNGDTALAVGTHTQLATFKGNPVDGTFRATHIAVRDGDRWLLAGMHMSPIGGPPPFAQQHPPAAQQS